ncbi:MAG: hypothetical protein JKY37_25650 [Nannocystaceae bacterium]|nr:hypothetical protein [Nannocystaceae bacterium]
MTTIRLYRLQAAALACCAGLWGCDGEPEPDGPGNQDRTTLAMCAPLPDGLEPIPGLSVAHVTERFGGLYFTLSSRALACGEAAAQHPYRGDGRGLSIGLLAEDAEEGLHSLAGRTHIEYETPTNNSVGLAPADATIELFEISEDCITGSISGFGDRPFDGGFQAVRCST